MRSHFYVPAPWNEADVEEKCRRERKKEKLSANCSFRSLLLPPRRRECEDAESQPRVVGLSHGIYP